VFSPNGIGEDCAEIVSSYVTMAYGKPMNELSGDAEKNRVRELA